MSTATSEDYRGRTIGCNGLTELQNCATDAICCTYKAAVMRFCVACKASLWQWQDKTHACMLRRRLCMLTAVGCLLRPPFEGILVLKSSSTNILAMVPEGASGSPARPQSSATLSHPTAHTALTTHGGHKVSRSVRRKRAVASTCQRKSVAAMTCRVACKAFRAEQKAVQHPAVRRPVLFGGIPAV